MKTDNAIGLLVRTLRKQIGYSQAELGDKLKSLSNGQWHIQKPSNFISQVERGLKRGLSLEELFLFVKALELTLQEQREFVLAAHGLTAWNQGISKASKRQLLKQSRDFVQQQLNPSYISDQYLNVLYANTAWLNLLDLPTDFSNQKLGDDIAYNLMMIVFADSNEKQRDALGEKKREILYHHIYSYRAYTMRYRHTQYYRNLHAELLKHQEFEHYWKASFHRMPMISESTKSLTLNAYRHSFRDQEIAYVCHTSALLSPYGELYTTLYTPNDEDTIETFLELRGETTFALGAWASNEH